MRIFSKCCICKEPTIDCDWVLTLKKKAICQNCSKKMGGYIMNAGDWALKQIVAFRSGKPLSRPHFINVDKP